MVIKGKMLLFPFSAVFCFRSNLYDLEKLSGTDVKCYWTKARKEKTHEDYKALPLFATNCLKEKVPLKLQLSDDALSDCRKKLLSAAPLSSLAKHFDG